MLRLDSASRSSLATPEAASAKPGSAATDFGLAGPEPRLAGPGGDRRGSPPARSMRLGPAAPGPPGRERSGPGMSAAGGAPVVPVPLQLRRTGRNGTPSQHSNRVGIGWISLPDRDPRKDEDERDEQADPVLGERLERMQFSPPNDLSETLQVNSTAVGGPYTRSVADPNRRPRRLDGDQSFFFSAGLVVSAALTSAGLPSAKRVGSAAGFFL